MKERTEATWNWQGITPDPTYSYRSWQDAAKGIVAQIDALKATVETLRIHLAEGGVVEPD